MDIETWPQITVYSDVYRDGDTRHDTRYGFQAMRCHFDTWSVAQVHDIGVTRHTVPIRGDFPDRATAEAFCLALVAAHCPAVAA